MKRYLSKLCSGLRQVRAESYFGHGYIDFFLTLFGAIFGAGLITSFIIFITSIISFAAFYLLACLVGYYFACSSGMQSPFHSWTDFLCYSLRPHRCSAGVNGYKQHLESNSWLPTKPDDEAAQKKTETLGS